MPHNALQNITKYINSLFYFSHSSDLVELCLFFWRMLISVFRCFPSKNMLLSACWASLYIFAGNKWKITEGSAINQSSQTIFIFGLFTARYITMVSQLVAIHWGKKPTDLFLNSPKLTKIYQKFTKFAQFTQHVSWLNWVLC